MAESAGVYADEVHGRGVETDPNRFQSGDVRGRRLWAWQRRRWRQPQTTKIRGQVWRSI